MGKHLILTIVTGGDNQINYLEANEMTKAERNAINACKKNLISNGVDKEMAAIMAKAFFESGLISPVVNGN